MMAALGLGTTAWGGRRPSVSTERESKLRRDQIVADLREEMGKGDKMAILMVHFGSAYAEAREALGRMNREVREAFPGVEIDYFQSNVEGVLIDKMQEVGFTYDGIVLNAGAYTHTSVALHDCIRAISCPVVEVHISNVHRREDFRHKSMLSAACLGVICGFGLDSYRLAVSAILIHNS